MRILVTAGNTFVPIDRVRGITNIFTGRTGTRLALHGQERGHRVTLVTSQPAVVAELRGEARAPLQRWAVVPYSTFDDLHGRMQELIEPRGLDVVIHCAAVSDYRAAGVYAPAPGTGFQADTGRWEGPDSEPPALVDRSAPKVKSGEPELWLRLLQTPKLIDF